MKAAGPFLTESRRDFLQRLMLNGLTVSLAAGYASNFFTSYPLWGKLLVGLVAGLMLGLGLLIKKGD